MRFPAGRLDSSRWLTSLPLKNREPWLLQGGNRRLTFWRLVAFLTSSLEDEIDGSNLFFMVNHYITKPSEEVLFEAHRDYADIQYVYEGEELIGVAPLLQGKEILPYDPEKDIAFYDVKEAEHYKAAADRLFILFPDDLHQPGVMTRMPEPVKKVVIKVKLETERLAMSN